MLYNRPISLGVDYFVNNLKHIETSKIDGEASGFVKNKAQSEIEENGKAILKGELYVPIGCEWMFTVLTGQIPRTGRIAYSSNHGTIWRNGKCNNKRIGLMGAQPGWCLGLVT